MSPDREFIKKLNFFEDMSSEQLDDILTSIHIIQVLEGELLIREGDPATHFYISLSGNFMIHVGDGRAITLHESGYMIGVSSIIGPSHHQMSVRALTDGMVLVMPGEDFQQIIERHPDLGYLFISKFEMDFQNRNVLINGHVACSEGMSGR